MENKEHKKDKKQKDVMKLPLEIIAMRATTTDPNGSYTGVPLIALDKPVQDADDL